jgi:FkbM family methyltransferase
MPKQREHELAIRRFIRGTPGALYDIGVGPKSEWRTLGKAYPKMLIFGCEPHPTQHEALLKAKFPGPLAKVAIGEQEGVATLHVPTHDLKCCSLLAVRYANATCEVPVWTLDRFDTQMGSPDRILLWLDVEGSELSALRSGPGLLASGRIRWINLEERRKGHCPVPGWCEPEELHAFLTNHGYVRIADYNRHATHQDAIYAHREEPCSALSR